MLRWLISTAALFAAISVSNADYVIIRVALKAGASTTPNNNIGNPPPIGMIGGGFAGQGGGFAGQQGVGIGGGPPRGIGGNNPGPMGMVGIGGGAAQMGNRGGFRGQGGGQRGGFMGNAQMGVGGNPPPAPPNGFMGNAQMGIGGNPPPAPPNGFMGNAQMGVGGNPPKNFGGGIPPPNFGPNLGKGGQPNIGNGGGPPNFGIGGGPPNLANGGGPPFGMGGGPRRNMGMMGMMGRQGMGMNGNAPPEKLQPDDYVTAVFEMKGKKKDKVRSAGEVLFIEHKWGKTAYYEDPQEIQWQFVSNKKLQTPLEQYKKKRSELINGSDHSPDQFLNLAEFALQVGLPEEAIKVFHELETMGGDKKERILKALAAYKAIKPIIDDEIKTGDVANFWKGKLGYASMSISKHYALVHNSDDATRDGVKRRLEALESNFKCFYLLFAVKGKALPAPTEKLPAILVDKTETFNKQRQLFEAELVADGFHARYQNLAVFSPKRVDHASRNYEQIMREVYRTSGGDLLQGKFPDLGTKKELIKDNLHQAERAQVLALVEQALREESEVATATHEGSAQLIAATGILPRNTNAPEWLHFGLASLFEMPKGPFPTKSDTLVKQAFYSGAGGINWAWRGYFNEMNAAGGMIENAPEDAFFRTLSDEMFDVVRHLVKENKDMHDPAMQTAIAQARCLSWAVTFFLFSEHFDEFMNFLSALSAMPRDVELNHASILAAFSKSFKLGDGDNESALNADKCTGLSKRWLLCMGRNETPVVKLKLEEDDQSTNPGNANGNPMFPNGGPGGFPPNGPNGGFPPNGPNGGFPPKGPGKGPARPPM